MPSRPPGCTGRDARALARVPSDYLAILMLLCWGCGLRRRTRPPISPPRLQRCLVLFGRSRPPSTVQGAGSGTPLQLCLMTAQLANGGFEIKPRVLINGNKNKLREYIKFKNENPNDPLPVDMLVANFDLKPLFRNQENINFVKDAMFAATNEAGGTSFRSRYNDQKFMFAGKTGSSQIKRFTELQRELEIKQKDIDYKDRLS